MSRIFEALQRSESERSGVEFPEPPALATELLQAAEGETRDFGKFQSLSVSVSPQSRFVSHTSRESLGAEKFRFLGVRLRQLQQSRKLKKVLVTSTIPEEGKSMVSANLAITLARKKQQKVLLLEGDLRRPVLAQQFGLGRIAGLSEWLQRDLSSITNIYHLEGLGFWLLPAGKAPENPLELMQSGRLADLLDQLTTWFDWIVIDSPPVLPLADTSVWTRLADGVLLVAREGKTEKRQLQRGLQALEQSKLIGVVLNSCTNTDHSDYYHRYGPNGAQSQGGLSKEQQPRPDQ
jgi:capsular exopolysaccharide synthesis family protein